MTLNELDQAIDRILNDEYSLLSDFILNEDKALITDTNAKKLLSYIHRTKDLRKSHLAHALLGL